jgi:tetratricopeptide (TPR) repeat protein
MRQADYQRAKALFDECIDVSRELGDSWFNGAALNALGIMARWQGDDERATAFHTEGLAVMRAVGGKFNIAYTLQRYGLNVAFAQGHYEEAVASFKESILLCREAHNRWMSEECLEGLAQVASAKKHYEHAARLFGAAEAQRELIGWRFAPFEQASHDQWVTPARLALGTTAFATAWAEGRAMTLEQAIEYAVVWGRTGRTGGVASGCDAKGARPSDPSRA